MKKLGFFVIGLVVILIIAIVTIPFLVPSELIKEKIQSQASEQLGRDVRIDGEIDLAVFPFIKAKTGPVAVDSPEGFSRTEFIRLNGLEAQVKLLPLLSKRVEISRFTLEEPVIYLERRADGKANWEIGDQPAEKPKEYAKPFSRNGDTLSDFESSIGNFTLKNGYVSYIDIPAEQNIEVSKINTAISLPSLAKKFKVDGDFTYDDTPITLDISLDSPRAFLDGQEASIAGKVNTDFAKFNIDGAFLQSQNLDFEGRIDANVNDVDAVKPFLGENAKFLSPVDQANFASDIRYVNGEISAKKTDLAVTGPSLNIGFKGDVDLVDAPIVNGTLDANIADIAIINPFLETPIKGLEAVKSVTLKADMRAADKGFEAKSLTANVIGPELNLEFDGNATYNNTISASGRAKGDIGNPAKLAAIFAPDLAAAKALGATKFSGDVNYTGETIKVKDIALETASDYVNAKFSGNIDKTGDTLKLAGNFDSAIPDIAELVKIAEIDIKDINAVKSVTASGQIETDGKNTQLSGLDAILSGGLVNASYKGNAAIGETQSFNGNFTADIPNMSALNSAISTEIPYAAAIGQVKASGQLSGALPANAINISNLNAELSGGQLNGNYKGSANYKDGLTLQGRLESQIPNLRALAATAGTELPPDTAAGKIFEQFALSGNVTGSPSAMALSGAAISFDKIQGKGDFGVDLTKVKPQIKGDLNLNALDLRPYMESYSSQAPEGGIQPWSQQPINVEPLKAVNADFTLNTPSVNTGRLKLGQTTLKTVLKDGVMSVNVPNVNLYGGSGSFSTVLKANTAIPEVEMSFDLKRLASNEFLGAVAGFTQVTGKADTKINFKGRGRTQAEIMKSLAGNGNANMVNGSISGIDTTEFLSGLDSALTSRSLPGGIGAGKVTSFNDMITGFSMDNGVATIQRFTINGPKFSVDGEGKVDIGNQNIDFRFLPKPTGSAATGIAQYGIPLRFSGPFGSASAGLDTDFLGKIVAAQAQQRAVDLVKEQVGGNIGGVLGGVLGGGSSGSAQDGGSPTNVLGGLIGGGSTPSGNQSGGASSPEQVLGGLLGGSRRSAQPANSGSSGQEQKKEPKIEEQIFDLFGKKKKK